MSANVISREYLVAPDGKSGSRMERLHLDDGSRRVVKRTLYSDDWISRVTQDDGRLLRLWRAGVFDRLPDVIDHAILDVVEVGGGYEVVMRDVSDHLLEDDRILSRDEHRRLLSAAAAMHAEFRDDPPAGMSPLALRYEMFGRDSMAEQLGTGAVVPELSVKGWDAFASLAPDVAEAVFAIHADASGIAGRLERGGTTLLHGDLKLGNLGFAPSRVVILDWGTQALAGPPAVELAWYLDINATRIAASKEDILDDIRQACGAMHEEQILRLALLGECCLLGWNKAYDVTYSPDPRVRERERRELDWWLARAREGLEQWSPV